MMQSSACSEVVTQAYVNDVIFVAYVKSRWQQGGIEAGILGIAVAIIGI